jgi:hypothetical protein
MRAMHASRCRALLLIFVCSAGNVCSFDYPAEVESGATLGVMLPIHYGVGQSIYVPFQKIGAAILLAIHHVNTRDGQVVGSAAAQLPPEFALTFRIADTSYDPVPAVDALLHWMYGFEGGNCLKNHPTSTSVINGSTSRPAHLHVYEASRKTHGVSAIVGAFNSDVSQVISTISSTQNLPTMSYASMATALSNRDRFPDFSRLVPFTTACGVAMVHILKNFGW